MALKQILESGANLKERLFTDYSELERAIKALRELGFKIVLTSGSWDLFHEGHGKYLQKAKEHGDILVVGVDSDAKVRKRKGKGRPIADLGERINILSHIRYVDIIALKELDDPEQHLIKVVSPDVLIISKATKHKKEKVRSMNSICGEVVMLDPQSETSTTAKIRRVAIAGQREFLTLALKELEEKEVS